MFSFGHLIWNRKNKLIKQKSKISLKTMVDKAYRSLIWSSFIKFGWYYKNYKSSIICYQPRYGMVWYSRV